MLFPLFLGDLSLLERLTPDIYISELFQVSFFTFSLNVERVRFVLKLQNASPCANPFSMPGKKC